MLSAEQIEQYKKDGYLLLKNTLNKETVEAIYREAREIFAIQINHVLGRSVDVENRDEFEQAMFEFFEKDFNAFVSTGKTVQHTVLLHKLGVSDEILNLVKGVGIEKPVIAVRPAMQFNSRFLSKDGSTHWKLGAHQDWRTGQGSLDSVVVWFPMVPAGEEIGALQVIPGSHTAGLMQANTTGYSGYITDNLKDEDFIQTEYEVGDVLIFSAFLVHRSGNNVSRNIRWSVQLRYNNLTEPTFIERGFPMPYIYKPQEELVTPDFPSASQIKEVYA
ncbi:phytanoyl-CoA dioxygenase family protein [Larkinella soli]|uniref:phytanoyl-CoA dioxygenase family protein n=1 Tax=Larkinella soli TaxID=1770527 RepID=UPI000FFC2F2B|nr:phytanoyl-CoA dioxygenase family protein [Larkinella soli]